MPDRPPLGAVNPTIANVPTCWAFTFSHAVERPDTYLEVASFATMPSRPSATTWSNIASPRSWTWSANLSGPMSGTTERSASFRSASGIPRRSYPSAEIRSKAKRVAGNPAAARKTSCRLDNRPRRCRRSKLGVPSLRRTTTSPSTSRWSYGSRRSAVVISGNTAVASRPERYRSVTARPSFSARSRYPSYLISNSHPGLVNGPSAVPASIGENADTPILPGTAPSSMRSTSRSAGGGPSASTSTVLPVYTDRSSKSWSTRSHPSGFLIRSHSFGSFIRTSVHWPLSL